MKLSSTLTEFNSLPTGEDRYRELKAIWIARGKTLNEVCKSKSLNSSNLRLYFKGLYTGKRAVEAMDTILKETFGDNQSINEIVISTQPTQENLNVRKRKTK